MPADLRGPAEGAEEAVPRLSCRYSGLSGRYAEGRDSEPEPQSQTEEDRPGRVREVQSREGGTGPKRRRWACASSREVPERWLHLVPFLVSQSWSPVEATSPAPGSGHPETALYPEAGQAALSPYPLGGGHPEECAFGPRDLVTLKRPYPGSRSPREGPVPSLVTLRKPHLSPRVQSFRGGPVSSPRTSQRRPLPIPVP